MTEQKAKAAERRISRRRLAELAAGVAGGFAVRTAPAAEARRFTRATPISAVQQDPVLGLYADLIFPSDRGMWGSTLGDLRLMWYSEIDPDKTVEIVNYLKDRTAAGERVFLRFYSKEDIRRDPEKRATGLVFFKGKKGAPFAVCCAGGGFVYVGAMHDSFPHALELSKKGYNAFAIIYRPGAQTALEDLSRALIYIFDHAGELGVSTKNYSVWGGSAGARMAAWIGTYGTGLFGERALPRPAAVIMQYTGLLGDVDRNTPPTYANVGDSDGIADWRTMERRIESIKALGIPAQFHCYRGLRHGFGLGHGTVAEGWIDQAVSFWESVMK
jgi:acetyl esterase/lipase